MTSKIGSLSPASYYMLPFRMTLFMGTTYLSPKEAPYDTAKLNHYTFPHRESLDRLSVLADGVFAISLTLLALELALPETAANLDGQALLTSLLQTWPKVLSYLTSFTVIATFWQAHLRLFVQLRRFDGVFLWLVFLQLCTIAFLPFPTAVVGTHLGDSVAEEFYYGSLLLTSLVWAVLRWYKTSGHRLVSSELSPHDLRRYLRLSFVAPGTFLVLMALIPLGLGRLIEPLLLGYFLVLFYVVLSILDWRSSRLLTEVETSEEAGPESAVAEEKPDSESGRTNS